jgi:hypothetical protein
LIRQTNGCNISAKIALQATATIRKAKART